MLNDMFKKEGTETIALENPTADSYKASTIFFGDDSGLEISIQATNDIFDVVRNVVVVKDFVNKVMVDFAECIFRSSNVITTDRCLVRAVFIMCAM